MAAIAGSIGIVADSRGLLVLAMFLAAVAVVSYGEQW